MNVKIIKLSQYDEWFEEMCRKYPKKEFSEVEHVEVSTILNKEDLMRLYKQEEIDEEHLREVKGVADLIADIAGCKEKNTGAESTLIAHLESIKLLDITDIISLFADKLEQYEPDANILVIISDKKYELLKQDLSWINKVLFGEKDRVIQLKLGFNIIIGEAKCMKGEQRW